MFGLALSLWQAVLGGGGDSTPGGATNVVLRAGSTTSGILKAGGSGYIKKAG